MTLHSARHAIPLRGTKVQSVQNVDRNALHWEIQPLGGEQRELVIDDRLVVNYAEGHSCAQLKLFELADDQVEKRLCLISLFNERALSLLSLSVCVEDIVCGR